MRYGRRKSFFADIAERFGNALCREGRFPASPPSLYTRLGKRFQKSRIGALCGDGYDRAGWQFRLRRRGMQWREESRLSALGRRLGAYVLESSAGYLGLLFLTLGISFLILVLIVDALSSDSAQISTSVSLILLSLPLLGSRRSLGAMLSDSLLIGKATELVGKAPCFAFQRGESGEGRPMAVLAISAVLVTLGGIFSPASVVRGLLFAALFGLLFPVPEVGLPIVLFLFPFLFATAHPTVLLLFLLLILGSAWLLKIYCGRRDFGLELVDLFVLLFALLLLLGGVIGYGDVRVGATLSFFTLSYFPVKGLLSSRLWRRRACAALCAGGSVCAAFGILQYFFGELDLAWVDGVRFFDIGGRVCSFFDNPNILAIYLLFVFPMALCAAMDRGRSVPRRCFFFIGALCMLLCIVFTWSRGAWLGALLSLVLLFLFHSPTTTKALLLGSPFAFCALPFLPQNVIRRFLSIGDLTESSIRYRLYTWQGVLDMIGAHPFGIGVGEAAFKSVYPHYAKSGIETVMHAHQLLLQITLELGWVGCAVFLLIVVSALLCGFGRRRSMGAPYALCGVLVMGCFDHIWYAPAMLVMTVVSLAFSLVEGED